MRDHFPRCEDERRRCAHERRSRSQRDGERLRAGGPEVRPDPGLLLRDHPRLQASEIVRRTGLPSSTVARILRTLVRENLLQREGTSYSIGLRVIAWSAAATAASDLIATARPW